MSESRVSGTRTITGGFLIVFEGIGGSGKSTLVGRLASHLESAGWRVVRTREPGGTPLGAALRTILLEATWRTDAWAEAFLFGADRSQTFSEVIEPALQAGEIVISDRGPFGTVAYQGFGRGLDVEVIEAMNAAAWRQKTGDLVIVVDVDPRLGLQRKGKHIEQDRFDREDLEFQGRAREGYLSAARKREGHTLIIDGAAAIDDAFAQVLAATMSGLREHETPIVADP
jgi:dTMP kinase